MNGKITVSKDPRKGIKFKKMLKFQIRLQDHNLLKIIK